MNTRMDRNRFNLGAYFLQPYARTEAHIRDVKDSGLDFICCMDYDIPALDLFAKYGLGAMVKGVFPGWWGGWGDNAGTMAAAHPISEYEEAVKNFTDHPAIWALDTGDEPSALDFEHYKDIFTFMRTTLPNNFPYLNLYPNYASVAKNNEDERVNQLGTKTYAEHIEEYCKKVPLDYICYDYYVYSTHNLSGCFENFRIVADAARRYGLSFWFIPQLNSEDENEFQSENRMRFQAFASMAFGAETIIWGCYTAGWWKNQVLDSNGDKTPQYEKMKKVNKEISTLGIPYMKYRNTATHFVGFKKDSSAMCEVNQEAVSSLDNAYFRNLRSDKDMPIIVGEMTSRKDNDKKALFVFAADDYLDENPVTHNIVFRCEGRTVLAHGKDGYVPVNYNPQTGEYSVEISSCHAILIEAI